MPPTFPHLEEPYRRRPIRPLGLLDLNGWRMKAYGIAYDRPTPGPELVVAARTAALRVLPQPPVDDGRYGVGFLGIHQGRGANVAFVDWWADENELHHHVFTSSSDTPGVLEDITGRGMIACVWDLAVVAHERDAWVACVMAGPGGPDLSAYLDTWLDVEI